MPQTPPLSRDDRRQRFLLRLGGVYDAGFGVPLLCIPAVMTKMLALPFPNVGEIWLRLDGIFLIIVGLIYWCMSQDPARYLGIMGVILIGKVGSVAFYLIYVFGYQESRTFLLFAVLDVIMFLLHYWALGPNGLSRIRAALQPAPVSP